jgi:thiosulfate oxidation carrier complex protein SoxZ
MMRGLRLSRRQFIAGAGAGLAAGILPQRPTLAQLTDLEGFDPIWRDAETAIQAFFGSVDYVGEGMEVDLPQHADVGTSVPLTVRFDSAMTLNDYPLVVHIMAHRNPGPHVLSAWFTPAAGRGEFSTRIRLETSQKVTAVAQMIDGRHIRVDKDVSVSFGACGQVGIGNNDDVRAFQPVTRVSVPATASRGEIIPIRAVISHPMETGMRRDPTLGWVDQRIISRFGCTFNGVEFFRTRPHPAVATNPYFSFFARVEESGTFHFSWYDMTDITYTAEASILVA